MVDHVPQSVYNRAKDFGWRTHIPLLERNMPFRRDQINECPEPDGGELPANVHNWVDVVMSGASTDRPRQSLLLLIGALR